MVDDPASDAAGHAGVTAEKRMKKDWPFYWVSASMRVTCRFSNAAEAAGS